jgi:PAS domain S-box-containing protein
MGIRTDITQEEIIKQYFEKELQISSQNFNQAFQLQKEYEKAIDSSNILSRTDTRGIITYVNDKFCEVSGYTKEELIGKSHNIIRNQEMPKEYFHKLWKTIKSGSNFEGIIKNKSKDGLYFWAATSIVPIKNVNGEIVEYLAIRHNLTELFDLSAEIELTQREIIYKMGEIGESRSKETGNHVKRVAEYSKLLATLYGLDENEAEILFTASPMHDIGKVGIPDSILKKPGKLDNEEFDIMKTHTDIGYEILKGSSREVVKAAAIVSKEHHEKWDGTGYPRGLQGNKIHIYGRITAIADVFDALGSDRCYKKAWELEKILALLREESGKHFDPDLIDLFLENLNKFLVIRDTFKD